MEIASKKGIDCQHGESDCHKSGDCQNGRSFQDNEGRKNRICQKRKELSKQQSLSLVSNGWREFRTLNVEWLSKKEVDVQNKKKCLRKDNEMVRTVWKCRPKGKELLKAAMLVVKSKLTVKTLTVLGTMMTVNSICHLDVKSSRL